MTVYIKSTASLMPEKSENGRSFVCPKPQIKDFIDPKESRRMSAIIKNGIFAGMTALKNAGIAKPDAIITGTGLGCLSDTVKFMSSILQYNEENLNPAPFIYSTHNTVGGAISILTGCTGYNSTFVHRGVSFESALLDAYLLSMESPEMNILAGGVDELTNEYAVITERMGLYRESSVPGEGAAFAVISGSKENAVCEIAAIKIIPSFDKITVENAFRQFIESNSIDPSKTVIFTPFNGDSECDNWRKQVLMPHNWKNIVSPKELTGEFMTSGALSFAMACEFKDRPVLVWNSFLNMENAFILIKNVTV